MPEIFLTALSSAFFLVRIVKGPWMRNPQYVAAGLIGAVVACLVINSFSPDMADDLIVGGIAGAVGSWVGIIAFDLIALA